MAKIRIYTTGMVDVYGELTVDDVKTIESKIEAEEIKIVNKELNICFNNIQEISNVILLEFMDVLLRTSRFSTILLDVLQNCFVETVKLIKDRSQISKYFMMHTLQHYSEFRPCDRSNFFLTHLRAASKQFEDLIAPNDVDMLSFIEGDNGQLSMTMIRVRSELGVKRLSNALKENTLTTLREVRLCNKATDEFWTAFKTNTHVTTIRCLTEQDFSDTCHTFNEALQHNTTIQRLKVVWKDATDPLLFEGLNSNSSITSLHCCMRRSVGTEFFTPLAQYLSHNTSLKHLHLALDMVSENTVPKEVFDSINSSAIHHLTLDLLTFDTKCLTEFIANNNTIVSLSIVNSIQHTKDEIESIFEALKQNETVCFWHHKINHGKYKDLLRTMTCEVNQVTRRNKKKREMYINDMVVLLFNIARGSKALQILPKELWLKIFKQVPIPGFDYTLHDILVTLFRDDQIRKVIFCPNK